MLRQYGNSAAAAAVVAQALSASQSNLLTEIFAWLGARSSRSTTPRQRRSCGMRRHGRRPTKVPTGCWKLPRDNTGLPRGSCVIGITHGSGLSSGSRWRSAFGCGSPVSRNASGHSETGTGRARTTTQVVGAACEGARVWLESRTAPAFRRDRGGDRRSAMFLLFLGMRRGIRRRRQAGHARPRKWWVRPATGRVFDGKHARPRPFVVIAVAIGVRLCFSCF